MTRSLLGNKPLYHEILSIAIPISLQSLFQSSLSVIDQIMVGQLGTNSVAGIGLGGRFPNLFAVTLAAVGTSSSIMISQYCGANDRRGISRSFSTNGLLALFITAVFFLTSIFFPVQILSCYTSDANIVAIGSDYLRIMSVSYIPLLITTMLSAVLRNTGHATSPMIASIISVITNTILNYVLIFGNFGAPRLGVNGTAIATTSARIIECLILCSLFIKEQKASILRIYPLECISTDFIKKMLMIASPIIINEFLWGAGDTMYSVIYGHIGTEAMAAMTLTLPIQNLSIGLFTGVSSAAAILVGNSLGKGTYAGAYKLSQRFIRYCILGSFGIGGALCLISGVYPNLFDVSGSTRHYTVLLIYIFSAFLFVKVSNMVLAGGILRSGGKTVYTLAMEMFGTWAIGVPIGFLAAMVWHLPIEWVYCLITTEEVVRLVIGLLIFWSKKWMKQITITTA